MIEIETPRGFRVKVRNNSIRTRWTSRLLSLAEWSRHISLRVSFCFCPRLARHLTVILSAPVGELAGFPYRVLFTAQRGFHTTERRKILYCERKFSQNRLSPDGASKKDSILRILSGLAQG